MKKHIFWPLLTGFLFLGIGAQAQTEAQETPREFEMQEGDTTYVMKRYVMVFLMRGDQAETFTEQELEELQAAHLENINRLAEEGIVAVAGPYGEDTELRGMFILDVGSIEEAKKHVDTDPMIKVGRLRAEYHTWWGAKGTTLP